MPSPFDELFDEPAVESTSTRTVRNVPPIVTNTDYKLAIVGECPGPDEVEQGIPFIGASGRELDKYLGKAGILRDACYIGNICQHRPSGNRLATLDWLGREIQGGLESLANDLTTFRPNLVWCLGGAALHAFKEGTRIAPPKRKTKEGLVFAYPNSIGDWRGSLFSAAPDSPCPYVKCVASYHPAAAMRTFEWMPLILLDLIFKVCPESKNPTLTLPQRDLLVNLDFDGIIRELEIVKREKPLISVDIEGYVGRLSCLSIAVSATMSFIIPFTRMDGTSLWDRDREMMLWRLTASILADPEIPKILQNSLYDRFVLQYSYGIVMRNVVDDTMLKHWELYCELEKSLGFLCSLYTNEPYYKSDGRTNNRETFHRYCCRDSATTHEISGKLTNYLNPAQTNHYVFNIRLLNALLYMELRGIRYNTRLARQRLRECLTHYHSLQHELNIVSNRHLVGKSRDELIRLTREVMCYKRDPTKAKADYLEAYDINMRTLLGPAPLTPAELGRLETDLDIGLNLKSPKFKDYLYNELKLPPQIDPKTKALTSDYDAILKLSKKSKHPAIELALAIGELRTRSQMLEIHADVDGRIRCGYNAVGTETGRVTCYTSPTGSGYNLQTIPSENTLRPDGHPLRRGMRDLFIADEGFYLFQCDLSGADGWTVGAHLASLGERTMLDDLKAKIKPAAAIAYMLRHGNDSLRGKPRDEIKSLLSEIKKDDYDYFMCKCGIWGICYLMGVDRLADLIFTQSEGKLIMSRNDVKTFRDSVFARYHPDVWHRSVQEKLKKQPYPPRLPSASGQQRYFFGRYNEILGEALANEPQQNTTYATNLAVSRLWHDPENRIPHSSGRTCTLRVEPLHQVHDALLGQFRIADTSWAITKIKSYFANPLTIAGISITIPFSGQYGHNWSFDKDSLVGEI